jgi:ribosome biogenesis protein YTM1
MDTPMLDAGNSSHYGQVQVHFTTNSPDIELPEGKRQLLVPTSKIQIQIQIPSIEPLTNLE